jgi:copper chaperone
MPIPHGAYGKRSVVTTREYQVSGMSCGHCEAAVKDEVAQIPGVHSVDVNARTGRLVVRSSIPVDASAVLGAVDEAGYQAVLVA